MYTRIKTAKEIESMRKADRLHTHLLNELMDLSRAGITTKWLDNFARNFMHANGATDPTRGYHNYPNSICLSVNDEAVHAIANDRPLESGDVLKLDLVLGVDGMLVDGAVTVVVDKKYTEESKNLLKGTKAALDAAVKYVGPDMLSSTIGGVIENVIDKYDLKVVKDMAGHGVGDHIHEGPDILNYHNNHDGIILKPGMTIAIEPIISVSSEKGITDDDGWTYRTADGSLAAQFERTLLITKDGNEVLTNWKVDI